MARMNNFNEGPHGRYQHHTSSRLPGVPSLCLLVCGLRPLTSFQDLTSVGNEMSSVYTERRWERVLSNEAQESFLLTELRWHLR